MRVLGLVIVVIVIFIFMIALMMPNGGIYLANFLNNVLATVVGAIIVLFLFVMFKDNHKGE